jgi:glutamyl-tRNA reductase
LSEIGRFVLREQDKVAALQRIKTEMGIDELMYASTCNRVFFLIQGYNVVNNAFAEKLFSYCTHDNDHRPVDASMLRIYYGNDAVQHFFRVTASLESMVLGESEIITQVREAFEYCEKEGLAGEGIRLAMNKAIESAKKIFTETGIARGNASVASVAVAEMIKKQPDRNASILFVGAGATNMAIAKILFKAGYKNFKIFNRTQGNGEMFAALFGCEAFPLDALKNYTGGFDVLVACTHSPNVLVTKSLFETIAAHKKGEKIAIDLAVPEDIDPTIGNLPGVTLLNMSALQEIVSRQLDLRREKVTQAEEILSAQLQLFEGHFRKWVFIRFIKASVIGADGRDIEKLQQCNGLTHLFKKVNPEKHESVCSLLNSVYQVRNIHSTEFPESKKLFLPKAQIVQ